MEKDIKIIENDYLKSELVNLLCSKLHENAKYKKNMEPVIKVASEIKNEHGEVVAGCTGSLYFGSLHLEQLWVDVNYRNKGYGRKLLNKMESIGIESKCRFSTLTTMDWEALNLYKKCGYRIEYIRDGYANNSTMYLLKKDL